MDKTNKIGIKDSLTQSGDDYKVVFDNSPIGILFFDDEGELVNANKSALKIFGIPKLKEVIGINIFDMFDINYIKDELLEKRFIKIRFPLNFDMIRELGIYDSERSGNAFFDLTFLAIGSGFLMQIQDITGEKKLEDALTESENNFRTILEAFPEGAFLIDVKGKILVANNALAKRFSRNTNEIIGLNIYDLLPPEFAKRRKAVVDKVIETKEPQYYVDKREGLYIKSYVHPILDENNEISKVAVAAENITERKKSKEELKIKEEQLRLSLEAANAGMWIRDPAGEWKASQQLNTLFGRSKDDPPLLENDFVDYIHPEDLPRIEKAWKSAREGESDYSQEYRIIWLDDSIHWLVSKGKIVIEDDRPRFMGITYDITELKKVEEELKKARDTLEEQVEERTAEVEEAYENLKENELKLKYTVAKLKSSNEELQSFAYITSHDLQEPLRNIASFAQLLQRRYKGQLDKDADEFIDFMVDGATRMKDMIQGLLEYSRIDREINFVKTDMNEKVEKAKSNLRTAIDESKAEITHDKLPTIYADPDQIVRVFQNLINNSIKFKKPEFPPRIHISAKKDLQRKEWVFSVEDNGIGMEPEYTNKIFEVFKRLHTMDEYEGTGIGLAIVKRIIERHGGRIWAESEFGVSSTFYFTIPI